AMAGDIPAWHAMEWPPPLVGPALAMDLPLTGRPVDARRAKRIEPVDAAVPPRILETPATTPTLEGPPPKTPPVFHSLLLGPLKGLVASQACKQVAKKAKREHYPVPYAILDIWKDYGGNALIVPPEHPSSIQSLIAHPTGRNLVRIFFLQERLKALGKGAA